MKTSRIALFFTMLAVAIAMATASQAADAPSGSPIQTLVKGNNAFAVSLYRTLGTSGGNLFFSPYSVSTALAMTYAGACGTTASQMQKALELRLAQDRVPLAFKKLGQALEESARDSGHKLTIANGLCLTGGDVSQKFKALLQSHYDAELFGGGLDEINGWVKKKTEGKIETILEQLDPNSVCVLLNAIYFKGVWQNRFDKDRTHEAPFRLSATEQVTTALMHRKGNYRLLAKQGFQALALPYKAEAMSMIVLLPQDVGGLPELEKQLTDNLSQWLAELDKTPEQQIEVFLPKLTLETGYDLVQPCKDLGIKDAFSMGKDADFCGMGWKKGDLWISQIKHKAVVEVNEEGTEAAAATAVEMATKSIQRPTVFRADHPFVLLIQDRQTGSILFMGRVANPAKAAP